MSADSTLEQDAKLEALHGYRTLQLEVARGEHAKARAVADERHAAVESQQRKIDQGHEAARTQMTHNAVLSVDALTRIRHFAALTYDELCRAQESLQAARDEEANAHGVVVSKLTDLRAVDRLREKRQTRTERERARRAQLQLDDHALLRLARRAKQADADPEK